MNNKEKFFMLFLNYFNAIFGNSKLFNL